MTRPILAYAHAMQLHHWFHKKVCPSNAFMPARATIARVTCHVRKTYLDGFNGIFHLEQSALRGKGVHTSAEKKNYAFNIQLQNNPTP